MALILLYTECNNLHLWQCLFLQRSCYMKKLLIFIIILLLIFNFPLISFGARTDNVSLLAVKSSLFSHSDMIDAQNSVLTFFNKFDGCTLKKLEYMGDSENQEFLTREKFKKDNIIVFKSVFDVDGSITNTGLNPNSTYTSWKFVVSRDSLDKWKVIAYGFF